MMHKKQSVLFVLALGFIFISSCGIGDCIKGEGSITTSTLSVADFSGIDLAFSSDVIIKQGTPQKVEATGHPNIIDKISTSVSNDIWTIEFEKGCYNKFELSLEITVPDLNSLVVNGSGDVEVHDFLNQNGLLVIDVNGSGNVTLGDFEGKSELEAFLSGSGDVNLGNFTGLSQFDVDINGSGELVAERNFSVEDLTIRNSASGDFLGFNISADNCVIKAVGSGNCELTAGNALDVTIGGSGDVFYKGNPSISQDINGSGDLINAN